MVLTNLIVSELLISAFGVPLDVIGLVIHGTSINGILCSAAAFIHTTLGMFRGYNLKYFNFLTIFVRLKR